MAGNETNGFNCVYTTWYDDLELQFMQSIIDIHSINVGYNRCSLRMIPSADIFRFSQ